MTTLWTSGKKQETAQESRYKKRMARANFRMHYDLAFDGGGSEFNSYYKTEFGARFSAFFWLHFLSWGGSAKLYPHPMPEPTPRHKKRRMTAREAYALYRRGKLTRAAWSAILNDEKESSWTRK